MKVLVIGGGGREHVLAQAYAKSRRVDRVFVAPGNDFMVLTSEKIVPVPSIQALDFEKIAKFSKKLRIDLVDVAQDDPLAAGLVDFLDLQGIQAFGPLQNAAEIEWNKAWARIFMQRYSIPCPTFMAFSNQVEAAKYVMALPEQLLYIKAAGLALGKGALRAENKKQALEAIKAMKKFGKSGKTFLIEECLSGEEFSLFVICDGSHYVITKAAQDHKTIFNADQGPNTGGIGCVAPAAAVSKKVVRKVEVNILRPVLAGMRKEERPYSGILYLGGMITDGGVKVVEFNARWGDPEAEVIIPSIQADYLSVVEATLTKKLHKLALRFDNKVRVSIAGCSRGYPNDYSWVKGKEIFGLTDAMNLKGVTIYGSGIKRRRKRFFANSGRIFHLVAEGGSIGDARRRAYEAMAMIYIEGNNLHYRTDVGWRDVERTYR